MTIYIYIYYPAPFGPFPGPAGPSSSSMQENRSERIDQDIIMNELLLYDGKLVGSPTANIIIIGELTVKHRERREEKHDKG